MLLVQQLVLCVVALVVAWISHWVYRWMNPKCNGNGKLPPGSMGFPILGETIEFFSPHAFDGIPPFIKKRMDRYGSIFRTSLVGQKVIVSTDPEFNYFIFQEEGRSFIISYFESFTKIIGGQSVLAYHGMIHKYLKNLILHLVSPETLRAKLLHEIDTSTCRHLQSWASHGSVDVKEVISNMIFEYFAKKLISYDEPKALLNLKGNFNAFMDGLISFPLNIPGTTYHACLQGRKNAMKVIKDIFHERKESRIKHHDFLDHLLEEVEKEETILDEAIAIDLIFVLLFAAYETTSEAITLMTKFISDCPEVLAELTKEHEAIVRSRDDMNSELTWQEYKSMTFTHMVINESVRLANIVPGIFRKAVEDIKVKGYTIPAGWTVIVVPSVLHLSPDKFEDPLAFNPWRWEGQQLHAGSKTFMAFGGGVRLCVGADFAKLQMAIFLHHWVTKYRLTVTKGGNIFRKPGLVFPNGFQIEIKSKSN